MAAAKKTTTTKKSTTNKDGAAKKPSTAKKTTKKKEVETQSQQESLKFDDVEVSAIKESKVSIVDEGNTAFQGSGEKSKFIIKRCKREDYIKAWNYMYSQNRKKFNENKLYDEINPALNKKPLGTETDNFCTVIYDSTVAADNFEYGTPVGIFSFVITPTKIIGKQFLVHPDYLGQGLGQALLIENEKTLIEKGHEKYYIGCSKCSAGIYKKYWGIEPFSSDDTHDMYKFNIELIRDNFNDLYSSIITAKGIKVIA